MKYFAQFNGTGTSLAVEKHLFNIIREAFEHTVIDERAIVRCVAHIASERDDYMRANPRAKIVEVKAIENKTAGGWWITAGAVYLTLIPIRHEFEY